MAVTNSDIAEIVQEAIAAPSAVYVEPESFSTKLSDESKELNDVLKVGVYSKGTAETFNASTQNYETDNGGGLDYKSVTLDQHFKDTFTIANNITRYDMMQFVRSSSIAVMEKAMKFYYDQITEATYGADVFTGLASTFDSDDVADLWQVAQDAEYNSEGRSLVLTNPYYTALLKDANLKQWDQSNSTETLRESMVTRLNNFEVLSSNVLATAAPAVGAENLVGFITDKSALAIATAVPAISDDESANQVITTALMQADNGLTMQFRKHYNPATGAVYGTVEMLTGAIACDTSRLGRLASA